MNQAQFDYEADLAGTNSAAAEALSRARANRGKKKKTKTKKISTSPHGPLTTGGDAQPTTEPKKKTPLWDAARAYAQVEYGEPVRDLRTQIAGTAQRQANIGGYYQTYLTRLQAARDASAQAYQAAATPMVQGQAQAGLSPEAQQAFANQQNLSGAFGKMIEAQGVNNTTRYDDMKANAGLAEVGWHMEEDKATDALRKQLLGLLQDKGAYTAGKRQELKQQKFDNKLATRHQAAEEYAVGLEAQSDAAAARAESRGERNTPITSGPFAGLTKGEFRGMSPKERADYKKANKDKKPGKVITSGPFAGYTESQVRALPQSTKDRLVREARKGGKKGGVSDAEAKRNNDYWQDGRDELSQWNPGDLVAADSYQAVQDATGAPFWMAKLLVKRARGKLTPAEAKRLRDAGVRIKPGAVGKKPGTSSGSGGGPNGNGTL
jgi:hypothetical protein